MKLYVILNSTLLVGGLMYLLALEAVTRVIAISKSTLLKIIEFFFEKKVYELPQRAIDAFIGHARLARI